VKFDACVGLGLRPGPHVAPLSECLVSGHRQVTEDNGLVVAIVEGIPVDRRLWAVGDRGWCVMEVGV
jgi:hypothetical protein